MDTGSDGVIEGQRESWGYRGMWREPWGHRGIRSGSCGYRGIQMKSWRIQRES